MSQQYKNIKTAENVFTIIEKIEELDQPTCSELTAHVGLSASSVYNYLKTLEEWGYVIRNDGRYRLTLKFLQKGRAVRNSYPIMHAATEPIDILSKVIDEYISVFVKEGVHAVMIHEANSHHAVHVPPPFLGEPFHLGKVPQGKVILSQMPESDRRDILSGNGLNSETTERLETELEDIRERGLAVDEGQSHENIWAVAAPVKVGDEIYGSLLISTVLHRLDERRANRELPNLLVQTVKEVEHRLSRYDFDDLYSNW
jgi:DNA-binding IclR family transcriptional regulator